MILSGSIFHEDFKNQLFVDQKATLVDLIYSESFRSIFEDWCTIWFYNLSWRKHDQFCCSWIFDATFRKNATLRSNLVNNCLPLVNKLLKNKIFIKNWSKRRVHLISTKIEIFSENKMVVNWKSENIFIWADMKWTRTFVQFLMKISKINILLTKSQHLLT